MRNRGLQPCTQRLAAPVHAFPVDGFRIAAGLIVFAYLARIFIEAPLFHAGEGLLDHALIREIFWFTWQPLFWPGMSLLAARTVIGGAMLLTLSVVLGWHPRRCALGAYLVVVCSIRHNFMIVSVDDVICHLLLFWLVVLPTGTTLSIKSGWGDWATQTVPGAGVRLFTVNIALVYFVAGISKWGSGMWLDGSALYAVMAIRPGWFSELIEPSWLPALLVPNYLALVLEPFFALIPFLKPHYRLKMILGVLLVGFHLGIIAGLDVVFANLGCMASVWLLFRAEIMARFVGGIDLPQRGTWRRVDTFAAVVVALLVGAMSCSLLQQNWRKPTAENAAAKAQPDLLRAAGGPEQMVFFGGLWAVGLIQQYRLLDWIDERNFEVVFEVVARDRAGVERSVRESELVPCGMRASLSVSYLLGATWLPVPETQLVALRQSMGRRFAARYARRNPDDAAVLVHIYRGRINPRNPAAMDQRIKLMHFQIEQGEVANIQMNVGL